MKVNYNDMMEILLRLQEQEAKKERDMDPDNSSKDLIQFGKVSGISMAITALIDCPSCAD